MLEMASKFRDDEHRMSDKQYDLLNLISSGNQTTFFEERVKSQISKRSTKDLALLLFFLLMND